LVHSARLKDEVKISLEHKQLAAREEEREEQDYDENGDGEWEDEQVEDGQMEDSGGEEEFAPQASDEEAVDEVASATKAVCCKCGSSASNGATVYSCSTGGSCRKCKKYGGQKAAERIAAPAACANGGRRSHSACKKAFER